MNRPEANGGPVPPLFEINLIGKYADRLHYRRRMERVASVVSIVLFAISGVLLLFTFHNVNKASMRRTLIKNDQEDLAETAKTIEMIEESEKELAERLDPFVPIMDICRCRVAWAPKLAALGDAMPEGMSVHKIDGAVDGVFGPIKRKGKGSRRSTDSVRSERSLNFSLIYLPAAGQTEDPIGALLGGLRSSPRFMADMDSTRLEASEKGLWDRQAVIFYRGLLQGTLEEPGQ